MRRLARLGLFVVVALAYASRVHAQAQLPPAIEMRVPKPPTVARGDGKRVLIYELHVTNLMRDAIVLKRVDVLGDGGATIATLADSGLIPLLNRPAITLPPAERPRIGAGLRAIVFVWAPVADGVTVPAVIRHRLTFQQTNADSSKSIVADGRDVPVYRDAVVIGPPLKGDVWLSANGTAAETGHRRGLIPIDGLPVIAQRFAIDYLKIDDQGRTFTGDRLDNKNYFAYGSEAIAVADAVVAAVKDSIPENVPGPASRAVPITLETVGGNHVILDLGNGKYAFYAHLQPGSLRVKVGDRVKRGQVVGLVGNSGNSTEPHLHFHVSDSTSPLGAEGIPYVHESYTLLGRCQSLASLSGCERKAPEARHGEMPFANQLVRFPK